MVTELLLWNRKEREFYSYIKHAVGQVFFWASYGFRGYRTLSLAWDGLAQDWVRYSNKLPVATGMTSTSKFLIK